MKHIFKRTFFLIVTCLLTNTILGQTTVTWIPTQADATALTNKSVHMITVGQGTQSFQIHAVRPTIGNTNEIKLEWDASANVIKATDNGLDKAGIAIYVPSTSDDIENIVVYMHTSNTRKTYYADGSSCPSSGSSTDVLAKSSTAYTFWNAPFKKNWYYAFGGRNSGSGEVYYDKIEIVFAGPAGPSTDATLKSLTYNGTSVPNFSADKTDYEVELPAGTTQLPTVAATATDNNAQVSIAQVTALPGKATVEVTAEDGTTKKTYTVTFTVASSAPKVLTATWSNIRGTATIDQVNRTITGEVTNGSTLTLTPTFTGDNISSWTPTTAQNFANSTPITYTFTSATNETTTYTVTITEAPPMSSDATLSNLTVAGYTINFSPTTYSYTVELKSGTTTAPAVSYTLNDSKATATETKATSIPGVHKIVVTAEDGTQQTYTINFTVAVPGTDLTLHEPEIYEAPTSLGGYGANLVTLNGRDYEVYYINRDASSQLSVATTSVDKAGSITNSLNSNSMEAKDGWFRVESGGGGGDTNASAKDEFKETSTRKVNIVEGNKIQLYVNGFDQFSIYAKDNSTNVGNNEKHLVVSVDGVKQTMGFVASYTIRRFDLTPGKHLVEVTAVGSSNNVVTGFSLRVAYTPRLKHITGNDSTQSVLQTDNIKPITYYLKNRIADAELSWEGAQATGISLQKGTNDTLYLQGTANCPNGEYRYTISAKDENGAVVSTISGMFSITSKVMFLQEADSIRTVYEKSSISPIVFRYYSIEPNDLTYTWTSATPTGLSFNIDDATNTLNISGTPTTVGTFTYTVSLAGANTLKGTIIVESSSPTIVPGASRTLLYLYKTNKNDGIFTELIKSYNYFARPAGGASDELADYSDYDIIVISEDVDANNDEVLNIIQNVQKPVLNMKSFTYSASRLGWGDPDNGSLINKNIVVTQDAHPIFKSLNKKNGDKIQVLDTVLGKGLMPATVTYQGTICLATAPIRSIDYNTDGEMQTFLHEVPESIRGAKYICMPIAKESSSALTSQGKQLLEAVMTYLLGTEATITLPELRITSFAINGQQAKIDQAEKTIKMTLPEGTDLTALVPTYTVADPTTIVKVQSKTDANGAIDFSDSFYGVDFVVTDYINCVVYTAFISAVQPNRPEGLDQIYEVGEMVAVYDIMGRMITMTNEDIYQLSLPRGVYLISTSRGTAKIFME